jgi:hypothetical protein
MEIRRPLAALMTAVALFGGGATLTACSSSGQDANDGTTDDSSNTSGATNSSSSLPVPDNSNREPTAPTDQDQPANGG